MKRRDPEAERARWSTVQLFKRGRRLRVMRTLLSGLIAGALGFGMVLAIGVTFYGRAIDVRGGWAFLEQVQR